MKSKVHPTYKTKYRVANWASYDRALAQRGDVTVWVSPEAIATWEPARVGARGGQLRYSNVAIETALTLRLLFHLPFRQTEGFLNSLLGMMGIDRSAPDHTTLSRRSQHLDLTLRRVPPGEDMHLIVDSTGLSIVGEGEWAADGQSGRLRQASDSVEQFCAIRRWRGRQTGHEEAEAQRDEAYRAKDDQRQHFVDTLRVSV